MNDTAAQLLNGIISGLLTSLIVIIFVAHWSRVILPWHENRIYKGIRLDEWKWSIFAGQIPELTAVATIKQVGHRVSGTISWREGPDITTYVLEGEFMDLILTATFKELGSSSLDRGTITLLSRKNNSELVGKYAWYDVESSLIVGGDYTWRKTAE